MANFKNGSVIRQTTSTATTGATTTLTSSSTEVQVFTGSLNQTVQLPNATTLKNGTVFDIVNSGSGTLTVNYNDASLAIAIAAGKSKSFVLTDNSTSNGSFDITTSSSSGGGASQSDLNFLRAGQSGGFSLTSIPLKLNPEELGGNVWISKSSILTARANVTGNSLNGFGYTVGGDNTSSGFNVNERYDDTNNYWISRTVLPAARSGGGCFSVGGFLYYALGYDGTIALGTTNTYQYTDSTNTWSTLAPSNSGSSVGQVGALNGIDGNGYLLGGYYSGTLSATAFVQVFVPTITNWTTKTSLNTARYGAFGDILNGSGYAVSGNATQTTEKYDFTKSTWQVVASTSVSRHESCVFTQNGFLMSGGGSGALTSSEQYSDSLNSWRARANLATGRSSTQGFSINGQGFMSGGYVSGATVSNVVESYRDFNYHNVFISSKLTSVPTNLVVYTKINNLTYTLPAQIRTDGDNWKSVLANDSTSILKQGESLKAKFRESGSGYIGGGVTSSTAQTSIEAYNPQQNIWINRGNVLITGRYDTLASALNSIGFAFGGYDNSAAFLATGEKYNEITNSSSSSTSLGTATAGGTASTLNGFIYIAAGDTGAGRTNTSFQFNDATTLFTSKASINTTRGASPAAFPLNGRIFMAAGNSAGGILSSSERYDADLNLWTTVGSITGARLYPSGFSINGSGYCVGGYNGGALSNVDKYNPQTDAWSAVSGLGAGKEDASCFNISGFGYASAGDNGAAPLATSQQYNDAANSWSSVASVNVARGGANKNWMPGSYRNYEVRVGIPSYIAGIGAGVWTAVTSYPVTVNGVYSLSLNGIVYSGGGYNGSGFTTNSYKFNSSTLSWVSGSPMPSGHVSSGDSAASLQGFGYGCGAGDGPLTVVFKLDPSTELWSNGTAMNNAHLSNGVMSLNGYLYCSGGNGGGGFGSLHDQFDPSLNSWTNKASLLQSLDQNPSESLNGFGYNFGGYNGGGTLTAAEKYNDAANTWTSVGSLSGQRRGAGAATSNGKIYTYGGYDGNVTYSASSESYNDAANVWNVGPSRSIAAYSVGGVAVSNGAMAISGNNNSPVVNVDQLNLSLNNLILSASLDIS